MIDERFGFISPIDDCKATAANEKVLSYDDCRPPFAVDVDKGQISLAKLNPSKKRQSTQWLIALKEKAIVLMILAFMIQATIISCIPMDDSVSDEVPAHIMVAGDTNAFIGYPSVPAGRHGVPPAIIGHFYASDALSWSLGHVPLLNENLQFDARPLCALIWDIDVDVHDVIILGNCTLITVMVVANAHMHITGSLSMNGIGGIESYSIDNNFVVDGWTYFGSTSWLSISNGGGSTTYQYYFNGNFECQWNETGSIDAFTAFFVFNNTFTMNGTTDPSIFRGGTASVDVRWDATSYFDFKGDVRINGTCTVLMGSGHAHKNFTCVNVTDYLLSNIPSPSPGFTFSKRPVFANISKCITCGIPPNINIGYSGALGLDDSVGSSSTLLGFWFNTTGNTTLFDGSVSDFIANLTINSTGTVYQTYGFLQIGSLTLSDSSVMNIVNGTYQMNDSERLFVAPSLGTAIGDKHDGALNVHSNFSLGSSTLTSDYVNIRGGTFYGQNGIIQVNNFDSSNGTFVAGTSNMLISHTVDYYFATDYFHNITPLPYPLFENDNPPGTLKTDGTAAGGFYTLTIESGAIVTLLSDVYVTHDYINLGGSVILNGFHIYLLDRSHDPEYTLVPDFLHTNKWLGEVGVAHSASEIAQWSLEHVPVDGENILFDINSVGRIKWDLGIHVENFIATDACPNTDNPLITLTANLFCENLSISAINRMSIGAYTLTVNKTCDYLATYPLTLATTSKVYLGSGDSIFDSDINVKGQFVQGTGNLTINGNLLFTTANAIFSQNANVTVHDITATGAARGSCKLYMKYDWTITGSLLYRVRYSPRIYWNASTLTFSGTGETVNIEHWSGDEIRKVMITGDIALADDLYVRTYPTVTGTFNENGCIVYTTPTGHGGATVIINPTTNVFDNTTASMSSNNWSWSLNHPPRQGEDIAIQLDAGMITWDNTTTIGNLNVSAGGAAWSSLSLNVLAGKVLDINGNLTSNGWLGISFSPTWVSGFNALINGSVYLSNHSSIYIHTGIPAEPYFFINENVFCDWQNDSDGNYLDYGGYFSVITNVKFFVNGTFTAIGNPDTSNYVLLTSCVYSNWGDNVTLINLGGSTYIGVILETCNFTKDLTIKNSSIDWRNSGWAEHYDYRLKYSKVVFGSLYIENCTDFLTPSGITGLPSSDFLMNGSGTIYCDMSTPLNSIYTQNDSTYYQNSELNVTKMEIRGTYHTLNHPLNVVSFDSYNGTFISNSILAMIGTGYLKTNGHPSGGFKYLTIRVGAVVTLQSDVYILTDNGYANGGTIILNGFHIYLLDRSHDPEYTLVPDFLYTNDANGTVIFTDQSRGAIVEWFWDFGDGSTSTDKNPIHNYTEAGIYMISLRITDVNGHQAVSVRAIRIYALFHVETYLTSMNISFAILSIIGVAGIGRSHTFLTKSITVCAFVLFVIIFL